jgi:hypothetical protein
MPPMASSTLPHEDTPATQSMDSYPDLVSGARAHRHDAARPG